jgi:hypothetical protein
MTQTKHTPGPLTVALSDRVPGWYKIVDVLGNTVADCICSDRDARLLAAASELYEALRQSERNVSSLLYMLPVKSDPTERKSLTTWRDMLRAALAQADGRTP